MCRLLPKILGKPPEHLASPTPGWRTINKLHPSLAPRHRRMPISTSRSGGVGGPPATTTAAPSLG